MNPDRNKSTTARNVFGALGSKMTYANVVATLSLFVALGGASYAAAVLPAGSVGPRQLRPGAVGLRALNFPLAASSVTDNHHETTQPSACNGGGHGPGPAPPCGRPDLTVPNPRREVRVFLRKPGHLLISATANVTKEGSPSTNAVVTLAASVDRRVAAQTEVTISGGETLQVPIQALVRANAGRHAAVVGTSVHFTSAGPGNVVTKNVSGVVTVVP
jgi:hypothetical protein